MISRLLIFLLVISPGVAFGEILIDFESLPVNAFGYFDGDISAGSPLRDNYTILGTKADPYGGDLPAYIQEWEIDGVNFSNEFNPNYAVWSGWSVSSVVDTITPGFTNPYASYPGGGSDNSGGVISGGKYAVAFEQGYFNLPDNVLLQSMDVTNTTYAYLSMRDGDSFAKKFGGASGDDPDFFTLTLTGYDSQGGAEGGGTAIGSIPVTLADFTFEDNSLDFILDQWTNVDLSAIANAKSVGFSFSSSDVIPSTTIINTPTYFAMDNLAFTAVPEPSSVTFLSVVALGLYARRRRCRKVNQRTK